MARVDWQSYFAQASRFHGDEIPDRITPVTPDEAARALASAYREVTGRAPTVSVLALLLGQWALETANGQKVHNFNFGNQKARSSDAFFQTFTCNEFIDGREIVGPCRFAAYQTAEDGARAFIELLQRRPHWWEGLQSGSASTYARALATPPAYFTADPAHYERLLKDRSEHYRAQAREHGRSGWFDWLVGLGLSAGIITYTHVQLVPALTRVSASTKRARKR